MKYGDDDLQVNAFGLVIFVRTELKAKLFEIFFMYIVRAKRSICPERIEMGQRDRLKN